MQSADPLATYALGHSQREMRRLILQAGILDPITERLLRAAGIELGMRVLDVGCGAGDVSILTARLVGATGSVVGIDRNAEVLSLARERAHAAGTDNIEFRPVDLGELGQAHEYDFVVGRYVLVHQTDMPAFFKAAVRALRPGGRLAFHELVARTVQFSSPPVTGHDLLLDLCCTAFRLGVPNHDAADRMAGHFTAAGLPRPYLSSETPITCDGRSELYAWTVETFRAFLPLIQKVGLDTAQAGDIDTVEDRMRADGENLSAQIMLPAQVCAWTRVGRAD